MMPQRLDHLVLDLQLRYARAIDEGELERWPEFFVEDCRYRITHRADLAEGLPVGIIYADSQAMLRDRVSSLREANVYEAQAYRHILSPPLVLEVGERAVRAETSFLVVRIMGDGESSLFASGVYRDRIERRGDRLRFLERLVVLDSRRIDTLLAIPI